MTDNNNLENVQILAAESYLDAKYNMLPATVLYNYKSTYNYILSKIKAFV